MKALEGGKRKETEGQILYRDLLSHTSSFIQNVLYEDSRAGIAVVDLFVAVKNVKDNLDLLTMYNNDVLDKIDDIKNETGVIRDEYEVLLGDMQMFFDKLDAEAEKWNFEECQAPKPPELPKDSKPCISGKKNLSVESLKNVATLNKGIIEGRGCIRCRSDVCQKYHPGPQQQAIRRCESCENNIRNVEVCINCGREMEGSSDTEKRKSKSRCQQPVARDGSASRLSISPEALIGALMTSALGRRKRREDENHPSKALSDLKSTLEKRNSEKSMNLSDSTIQIICDVCEILSLAEPRASDGEESRVSVEGCEDSNKEHTGSTETETTESVGSEKETKREETRKSEEDKEDSLSDEESIFEEALSDPFCPSLSKPKPSVTCMGDLTRTVATKKSVSTLTATNELVSSWMEKLKEEIKSKIRNLKSMNKSEVVEQPLASEIVLKGPGAPLEFTITANTPIGVFDVSVRQYKNRRHGNRSPDAEDVPTSTPGSANEGLVPVHVINVRDGDFYWSDDSLNHSDSERGEVWSNSGEDELEEFIEISFENVKKEKGGKLHPKGKGALGKVMLKEDVPPFFEIRKYEPRNFVQEIVPKRVEERASGTKETFSEEVVTVTGPESNQGENAKQLIIKDSANDIVIYIQVQVEDEANEAGSSFVEYKPRSWAALPSVMSLPLRKEIKAKEEKEERGGKVEGFQTQAATRMGVAEEARSISEGMVLTMEEEDEDEVEVKTMMDAEEEERAERVVGIIGEQSEVYLQREIPEKFSEEKNLRMQQETAVAFVTLEKKMRADILIPQTQSLELYRTEPRTGRPREDPEKEYYEQFDARSVELENALNLIHEIENNVVDVKLSNAISILPHLESELRKHLQRKLKNLGDREDVAENSVDNFFSAVEFWPDEEPEEVKRSEASEERLENLLRLLSDLEEAVKFNECSRDKIELCDYNSSKIYKLLHALTNSIRELEDGTNVVSLAETLDIASQLDTAVRDYDSLVKNQNPEYAVSNKEIQLRDMGSKRRVKSSTELERAEGSVRNHMKNVRKKVFEIVEEEAVDTEGRLEKDFDRVDRLERENEEVIKFLEAFLEKTQRRTTELGNLKFELRELASVLNSMYEELVKAQRKRSERQMDSQRENSAVRADTSKNSRTRASETPLRDTVSGLLYALDSLKSRARQKNAACQEILAGGAFDKSRGLDQLPRASRSSFTAKNADGLRSSVIEFKKIGEKSLYLSWTKPEGSLAHSIVGYEIIVNEKLNQKVRNPQRLQAVLYAVDLTKRVDLELYALLENGGKGLLLAVTYSDD